MSEIEFVQHLGRYAAHYDVGNTEAADNTLADMCDMLEGEPHGACEIVLEANGYRRSLTVIVTAQVVEHIDNRAH